MEKKNKLVGVHVTQEVYLGLQELRHKKRAQYLSDIIRGLIIEELEANGILIDGEINSDNVDLSDYHRE